MTGGLRYNDIASTSGLATAAHCLREFKKAGVDSQRARGVLVHGFRHTFATELANENISVYALMKLLGHDSMATSQRYVDGAGTQNRAAAAQDPLYDLSEQ